MKELVLQAETDPDLGLDDKYDVTFGYKSPGEFDIGDDKKRITDMTVSELRQFQKDFLPGFKERNPKFGDITDYAAGVYQITGETLDDFLANNPDYDIDTQLFDEQFQDDVFDWMMETGGIDKVISGDLTLEEFYSGGYDPKTGKSKRSGMLQRFASLPQLSGESEGETIYGGGVNKATIDTTAVREKFKGLSLYDDTIHHAGTLDEVNVTAQAPERAQHETSDIAMAGDTSILTRDDVPIQAGEDTAFKGPFKKLRQKRWEKKLGLGDYAPTPEYYASQQEGEGFKGVATGGQVNPEMNPTGYATGGQIAGQAARILGMSAPAAYNIAYGLTEEPKKLEGNYMVAPIQDPEPIDVTPELRAIEKAGAVTRSGGRARSSMAGQIASQTAEQEAVSQLYRDKRAIDTQADLRAEEVNAGIRSRNAQMEFAKDMQHIQAEEAMQQYINTGMGQIGQIAQTLGTEALAREQINIMGEHYASIAEQGDAMLKLRQQEIDQAGKLLEGMVDTGGTGTLPGDPAVPGGYAKQTGFGGQFLSEGYTEARGDEGRWTAGSTGGAEDGDPVTVAEGDIPVWGTAEGDWDTVSGKALDYIRSKREERGQVGAGKFSGYTDIQSFEDLTEDEQKEYFDYIDSQDDASRFYAIGDVPGVGYQTEAMDLGGKKTINSLMRTRQDHTGQTIPYLNEPDLQAEFNNDLYLANNGTWWQKMSDEHLSGYFSDSEDVVAPEYFNPMQYFDSPEEYASYMREWLGARGHYAVGRKDGKDVVYRYNKPSVSLGGMDLTPQGKLGGSFIEHKDPTLLDQVASAARFGLETGFTKSGSMPGMLKTGSFITKAAGGGFNIIKKGDKVAKGMKLIAGPQGELRLVKSNAFLQQGWKRVAKADEAITAAKIRAVGGKAYDATGAFKGAQPFLPTGFYVTGGGKVIAQATGKAVKGVVVKPISALANTKAVKTALGLGRQGMQKVWQGTKYVFSNGRWYKVTAQKAKETVKGTREAIKSGVKTIKKAATN